jgi:hypothetical protein
MSSMNATLSAPRRRLGSIPVLSLVIAALGLTPALGLPPGSVVALGQDAASTPTPFEFERADMPATPAGLELWDVVAGGPGFVAVGGGFADSDETSTTIIWVSEDGRTWQSVPLFGAAAHGVPRAVTATPDGLVAVGSGCCPDESAVWLSPDGLVWERLPAAPSLAGSVMLDVTATPDGLVALGCSAQLECIGGLAWTSADGRTWSDPIPLDTVDLLPLGVAATESGVLALGTGSAFGDAARVALSPDGTTWASATTISLGGGSMEAAVERPEGIVAAGGITDAETGRVGALIATSDDGAAWVPEQPRSLRGTWIEDLTEQGEGLVLVGWRSRGGDQVPTAAWTTDLASYQGIDFPRQLKDSGTLHAATVSADGSTVVAVGASVLNRGLVPSAFVSKPVVEG